MSDIVKFLMARIDEDEAVANEAADDVDAGAWGVTGTWALEGVDHLVIADEVAFTHEAYAPHIARHDPARILAECESKRRIVALHVEEMRLLREDWDEEHEGGVVVSRRMLVALAGPYADHPDYDPDWATS